jgi:hypothetical protein
MANEIALPAIPGVSALNWTLERNVAVFESPLTKASQRLSRTGHRWRAQLRFPLYNLNDAGVLAAWMDQISRGDRWLWLTPPQNSVRGNWNPADLITNGTFVGDATTGWTGNAAALSVNARRMKVLTSSQGHATQNVTMEAGKPHALLVDGYVGNSSTSYIDIRRQSDSVVEGTSGGALPGRFALILAPSVAPMTVLLNVNTAGAGKYIFFGGVSLTRCLQVAGGSQTGTRLNVDGGPASVNAALRAGEFVSVLVGTLYQMVRLTEDFDTDSSGAGTLVFEPALRAAPADDAAVIVRNPFARFRIADSVSSQAVEAPNFSGFTLDAIEDVTA